MRSKKEMNADIAAFGVKYASEKLQMEQVNVGYRDLSYFKTLEHAAIFVPKINCIIFNLDWLKDADYNDVLKSSFLQTRSAYQHACLKYPSKYKLDSDTLRVWKQDFRSTLTPEDEEFYELSITKDSFDFARKMMSKLSEELES